MRITHGTRIKSRRQNCDLHTFPHFFASGNFAVCSAERTSSHLLCMRTPRAFLSTFAYFLFYLRRAFVFPFIVVEVAVVLCFVSQNTSRFPPCVLRVSYAYNFPACCVYIFVTGCCFCNFGAALEMRSLLLHSAVKYACVSLWRRASRYNL